MPKISVVICAYNAGDYIEKAVKSCLLQTLADFELIIVNDGSRDNTLAVCSCLAMKDRRIRVIDIENSGPSRARNIGMSYARGEFVTFCDADDTIDSGAFETMYEAAVRDGSDMVICGYHHDLVKDGEIICTTEIAAGDAIFKTRAELFQKFIELKSKFIIDPSWNKLFSRRIIAENGLMMPVGELFEDTSFVLSFLGISCKVSLINKCFYHYVQREKGSITRSYNPRKLDDLKRLYGELADFTVGTGERIREYCSMFYIRTVYSCLSELCIKGEPDGGELSSRVKAAINDGLFTDAVKKAVANSFSDRVTLFAAKTGNITVNKLYCRILYFIKNKARRLFNKLK